MNEAEFRDLLRDTFKVNPPSDFLNARFGVESLSELSDDATRELALGEWIGFQRVEFEESARKAVEDARSKVENLLAVSKTLKSAGRTTERNYLKTLVAEARAEEAELQRKWQLWSVEAEQKRSERDTLFRAYEAGIAHENARNAQFVDKKPDAGAKELNALAKALKVEDAERAAKVEPIEAAKAPKVQPTINTAVAKERLDAANKRLRELDREMASASEKLSALTENRTKLEAKLKVLTDLRRDIARANKSAAKELPKAQRAAARAERRLAAVETGAIRTVEERIEEIVDSILRGKDAPNGILREIVGETGRLKERRLFVGNMLADPRIERFLVNDAEVIAERYAREIAPRIAFRQSFGNDVDDSLSGPLNELRASWREKIAAAPEGQREKLAKLAKEAEDDFIGVRDRLLGRLGIPDDPSSALMWLNRQIRGYNVTRLLGLAALSSVTDIATGVLATRRAFGWVPLFGRRVAKIAAKMPDHELRALMLAVEQSQYTNRLSRALGIEDTMEPGGFGTGTVYKATASVDRGLNFLARHTSTLSGLRAWSSRLRFIFGAVQVDNMIRELGQWSTLPQKQRAHWNRLGIDESMAQRIAAQLRDHTDDIDGVKLPNGREWTDAEAYRAFQVALTRTMNESVVVPGAGDTPLFMSKPAGRLMLQFMSFAFSTANRFTRLAWQQRDINSLIAVSYGLSLGTLGYVAREYVKGTDDKGKTPSQRIADRKVGDWFYEAFTRSPLPGALTYGMDAIVKLGARPVQEALGVDVLTTPSRMRERAWWSTALGPTVGLVENFGGLITSAIEAPEKGGSAMLNKAARLAPFGNLLPILVAADAADMTMYGRDGAF
jgi:hypothetical protein